MDGDIAGRQIKTQSPGIESTHVPGVNHQTIAGDNLLECLDVLFANVKDALVRDSDARTRISIEKRLVFVLATGDLLYFAM